MGFPRRIAASSCHHYDIILPMKVSVVIPAYNEQDDIVRCLSSLQEQAVAPYEIIVADNNSTDATARLAVAHGARVVPATTQGIGFARTAGFDAAKGDVIARIDSDCIAAPDWIERIIACFTSHPALEAVAGRGYPLEWGSRKILRTVPWVLGALDQKLWKRIVVLYGYNFAIKRSLWHQIRDEIVETDGIINEDIEFSYIVGAHTKPIVDPSIRVDFSIADMGPRKLLRYLKADRASQRKYGRRR